MSPRTRLRCLLWLGVSCAATAAAWWARHAWVQAPGMGPWCEQVPDAWPCPARLAVIQAFLHHRLSWGAWVMAGVAAGLQALARAHASAHRDSLTTATALHRLGDAALLLGLCWACSGLVLYDTDRSAAAVLVLALLALKSAGVDRPTPFWR